jgi:hypothetical protein
MLINMWTSTGSSPQCATLKIVLALVALTLGSMPVHAADRFVGIWRLNKNKSTGSIPADEVVTIERRGQVLAVEVRVVTETADNQTFVIRYTAPAKGGPGEIEKGPYSGVSLERVSSREMQTTYLTNGKEARSTTASVSKDGKTLTSIGKAQESGGAGWTMVFDKQQGSRD